MDDPFRWKLLIKALILPPVAPLVVALLGVWLLRRRPRLGRALAVVGVGSLTLLAMPLVARLLLTVVDGVPPLDLAAARDAQAIVILGGGLRRQAPEYGGDTMNSLTLERVRYGARIAKLTGLPVLVSGGRAEPRDATEAAVMKAALEDEYGVRVRWVEDRSRDTHENAQMSARMLRADGVTRILLVGHGFDMPRAIAEFAAAGITATGAPTRLAPSTPINALDLVPTASGLLTSYYALYEIYGEAWRRLTAGSAAK